MSKDGYIIPVDDKYFRIDSKCMGFKYGGSIICIGMVTNLIGEDFNPTDNDNVFEKIQIFSTRSIKRIASYKRKEPLCNSSDCNLLRRVIIAFNISKIIMKTYISRISK